MVKITKMSVYILIVILIFGLLPHEGFSQLSEKSETKPDYVLVIHGGAGAMERSKMSTEAETAYIKGLLEALEAGEKVLKSGGSSTDAIIAAITWMEDNPLFNAGRGAVYNEMGEIAHDASIMEGAEGKAGAVGAVGIIRNPILAAKAIMDDGRHVFLIGKGAEDFAVKAGVDTVNPSYFFTQARWDSYEKTRQTRIEREFPIKSKGTVGAVALDKNGNLAAGTSTGGMHYKRMGRLGDSPVIGAGTWADNQSCAISATGHGEYFIRNAVAHDIAARMLYAHQSLEQATYDVVMKKLKALEAGGGIIAVDKDGNIAMPFNTSGMFRAYVKAGEAAKAAIYVEEN
ncbi:MAG: beta-aspartyl-peptidase [Bacteroidetes bacterium HGW-Bacteroidetes-1]|jgi:beta-aspartyl-peptidase (threonine type)|nr:MAG: beta-aspartyl-peptidase [Bacteroidetes bacterium HGW-Bacteroidetes-1]